jgi:SNF2 family DNA or RNA helicase
VVSNHETALQEFKKIVNGVRLPIIDEYWLEVLKPHQITAAAALTVEGLLGACLFDEQGTGKTLTAVAAFDQLVTTGAVDKLIVIAPKTLLGTWAAEFEAFLAGKYRVSLIEGDRATRYQKMDSEQEVYLISYETADSDRVAISSLLKTRKFLIVFDESFYVKNEKSNRSVSSHLIRKLAARAFVLCGTPATNSSGDLVHQFDLADLGYTFSGYTNISAKELSPLEMESTIESRGAYVRRLKEEVLPELADKSFEVIECSMTAYQAELYAEAKRGLELLLRKMDNTVFRRNLATYFQKRSALLQICVSPALVGGKEAQSGKYSQLEILVKRILSQPGKKVVIWSTYTKSLDHIMAMFQDRGIVRVDGTVPDQASRQKAISSFQSDPAVRIFLGNPAAAGAGITLTAASDAIYVSFSNQAAHYMQSIDRIHRIGQKAKSVTLHLLVAKSTIETSVVRTLARKQSAQSSVLGDISDQGWSLAEAIQELKS